MHQTWHPEGSNTTLSGGVGANPGREPHTQPVIVFVGKILQDDFFNNL